MTFTEASSEEKPDLHPHQKIQHQKFAKEYVNTSDAEFWKQVLWTDESRKQNFLAAMSKDLF